ncbi:MAG: hypothetical protein NTZ27_12070 [Ignavibacteriales bacterium]|nr:hypothetical protein [Ignavibacteriales bacterium]
MAQFNDKIIEISETNYSSNIEIKIIKSEVVCSSVSPDERYLIFSTNIETLLVELSKNTEQKFLNYPIKDIKWSLSGSIFSFKKNYFGKSEFEKSDTIFIYSFLKKACEVVLIGETNTYTKNLLSNPIYHMGDNFELNGVVEDIVWLSDDRFIFQRGVLNYFVNSNETNRGKVKSNTTSLAFLKKPMQIIDSGKRWWVKGLSKDASYLLLSKTADGYDPHFHDQVSDSLFVVPSFSNFDNIVTNSIYCRLYEYVGFMPGTSKLFFVEDDTNEKNIILVNPRTLEFEKEFDIKFDDYYRFDFFMDKKNKLIAYRQNSSIVIKDIYSGGYIDITNEALQSSPPNYFKFLCWVD